ncbi:ABC transporter ATP-binding protein [Actinobacteria bacterium YIM 96077]|uniref:Peptide ABC transporter ATP-binding protein n=1 Tax=Phytoactinopolyspora halophila TaxID=1981511 RepID=A0A329QIM7_9ACTN|nr:oligopeptide/dipeptide ABC transporter ATP-binding protein [Phytoactinopolyspora halophila]AYY14037.1 ABC transporter ATP-binding protein [Actinobacteria bacterium YIM 96077]RAW10288.1 peptide ABC transporter ATP-binding protein [Phytoactinopolyspora halophila]
MNDDVPLLDIRGLTMRFPVKKNMFGRVTRYARAVENVDLAIARGETLGLVGESGCGKTTLGRCIVRTHRPVGGSIFYRNDDGSAADLAALTTKQLRPYQREVRLIFQDPFSSLNPRMTLLQIVGEPLHTQGIARGSELEDRVAEMLRRVGLRPEYMRRYPHAFSGGERQRVNIARALIPQPRLVVADEPVSALDVSVRAQILNLLLELQEELDLTYLFISHDLSVVESICHRVAVMYFGSIVETAATSDLYTQPQHPYTEALLSAVPQPDPRLRGSGRIRLPDDLPDPTDPPAGCSFHTRCPYARPDTCAVGDPPGLHAAAQDHEAACHFSSQLHLTGVASGPEGLAPQKDLAQQYE